ncbi:SDR family oxidoreductase [Myxococcus sp. K38C18041901]|uniref:SDR family NAD(P)-dependent oxidoreductase n=1 Tax=Myxococcus guangdongensis TaxID=2906760 RepID=UPI0020A72978|nr:SDR family oxidoreductase [Myxococcus guangdongensis]MCP3059072.1 SDR family oxidoreductase [Myxococcus guangdongensis]
MGALDGRIAVITGGATGIGLAIAERFASEGAEVVIASRRQGRLDEAVGRIGHGARGVVTDVGDEAQVVRLMDSVPRVDLLVTCAGSAVFGPVETVPMSAWEALFKDRFFGQLSAVRHAVPKMREGGAILLCSGIAGHAALANYAGGAGLCGGINAMGRSLAVELAPRGLRVNVLSPGLTKDTALDWGMPATQAGAFLDTLAAQVPMKRAGAPRDMADAAYFLATCAYATGMVLDVDGGWTAV